MSITSRPPLLAIVSVCMLVSSCKGDPVTEDTIGGEWCDAASTNGQGIYWWFKYGHTFVDRSKHPEEETSWSLTDDKLIITERGDYAIEHYSKQDQLLKLSSAGKELTLDHNCGDESKHFALAFELVRAAEQGNLELVRKLVESGEVNVNVRPTTSKGSALIGAAANTHVEVVRYLLAHGADVKVVNNQEKTALMLATRWDRPTRDPVKQAQRDEVVRLLELAARGEKIVEAAAPVAANAVTPAPTTVAPAAASDAPPPGVSMVMARDSRCPIGFDPSEGVCVHHSLFTSMSARELADAVALYNRGGLPPALPPDTVQPPPTPVAMGPGSDTPVAISVATLLGAWKSSEPFDTVLVIDDGTFRDRTELPGTAKVAAGRWTLAGSSVTFTSESETTIMGVTRKTTPQKNTLTLRITQLTADKLTLKGGPMELDWIYRRIDAVSARAALERDAVATNDSNAAEKFDQALANPGFAKLMAGTDPKAMEQTAFCNAAAMGDLAAVRAFLDRGVPIDKLDERANSPRTALIMATKFGQLAMVKLLLGRGATKHLRDVDGKTALDYARELNHAEMIALLR